MDAESRIFIHNVIEGLPNMTSLDPMKFNLLIIDDLMHEMNEMVATLFTKDSHDRHMSVLLLTQNIFHQNKHSRTVSLKCPLYTIQERPRRIADHQNGQANVSRRRIKAATKQSRINIMVTC